MSKKDTIYIQHSPGTLADPAVDALVQAHGPAGYGVYWAILEVMRMAPGYKITGDEAFIARLAHKFYWEKPSDLAELDRIVVELNSNSDGNHALIQTDSDGKWYSQRLIEDSAPMDDLRDKQRRAGLKRALDRAGHLAGDLQGNLTGDHAADPNKVTMQQTSEVTIAQSKQVSKQVSKEGQLTSLYARLVSEECKPGDLSIATDYIRDFIRQSYPLENVALAFKIHRPDHSQDIKRVAMILERWASGGVWVEGDHKLYAPGKEPKKEAPPEPQYTDLHAEMLKEQAEIAKLKAKKAANEQS